MTSRRTRWTRWVRRRRLAAAALGAGLLALGVAGTSVAPTSAFWQDSEAGQGAVAAGTVSPPTGLGCSAGLLSNLKFTWSLPAGGVSRTGYSWVVAPTGGLIGPAGNGTINDPSATEITLPSSILAAGTGSFTLSAIGPGLWRSTVVQGSLTVIAVLGVPVNTTCSVP